MNNMAKKKKNNIKKAEYKPLEKVKLEKLKRMIKSIERDYGGNPEIIDNMDITFEYIIASLFPKIMDNINEEFTHQYISGFNDRLDIKKVTMVDRLDDINALNYIFGDIEKAINNISVLCRLDTVSDNDKKVLKQTSEILRTIYINLDKMTKE